MHHDLRIFELSSCLLLCCALVFVGAHPILERAQKIWPHSSTFLQNCIVMFYKPELDFLIILSMALKFLVKSLNVYSSLVFQFYYLPSVGLLQNSLMCSNCPENTWFWTRKVHFVEIKCKSPSILIDSRWLPMSSKGLQYWGVYKEKPTNPSELRSIPSCTRSVLYRDLGSFQGKLKAAGGCSWEGNPADISNALVCRDVLLLESLRASLGKAGS